ncbi:trypsin-like peptidase domain-containing protein [Streptomyces sp. SBC-4]|nr:trypsin-like peptidase domain-containing protein [Streptomyces sp. SBC-4]MDV5145822.1 trypsin-like peptidase domain-containing protein [Streptomyces sp. SBC-4]
MSAGSTYERLLSESRSGGLEGADGGGPPSPPDPERLITQLSDEVGRLEEHLGRRADPAALERLRRGAEYALREVVDHGDDAQLGPRDMASLEAVVHSDGTRPVLFVEDDFFDVTAPAAANWAASLSRIQAELRTVCRAVGRVNDPNSLLGYQGTAWAIDDGVVVTNYHVLEAISTQPSRTDGEFGGELKPGVAVDFGAEVGGGPSDRVFRIGRVLGVGRAGAPEHAHPTVPRVNFDGLDLAVLELDRVAGRRFPTPLQVARGDDPTTHGALASRGRSVYLVGFPGSAGSTRPDVFAELFAGVKGVKRLTPGVLTEGRGEVADDARRWIISHDASTLGGSSGSLVVDLEAEGRKVLGLHFAGVPDRVNWAHGLEGATPELAAVIPGWRSP